MECIEHGGTIKYCKRYNGFTMVHFKEKEENCE